MILETLGPEAARAAPPPRRVGNGVSTSAGGSALRQKLSCRGRSPRLFAGVRLVVLALGDAQVRRGERLVLRRTVQARRAGPLRDQLRRRRRVLVVRALPGGARRLLAGLLVEGRALLLEDAVDGLEELRGRLDDRVAALQTVLVGGDAARVLAAEGQRGRGGRGRRRGRNRPAFVRKRRQTESGVVNRARVDRLVQLVRRERDVPVRDVRPRLPRIGGVYLGISTVGRHDVGPIPEDVTRRARCL